MTAPKTPWPLRIAAVIAAAFGTLTVLSGGTALFGGPALGQGDRQPIRLPGVHRLR